MSGYALISKNEPFGPSGDFNAFSAPVGSYVPFLATYSLLDGRVWEPGIFDTRFKFSLNTAIDFTRAVDELPVASVPEPHAAVLWIIGLLALRRTLAHGQRG